MSRKVDERVVSMKFDNKHFEANVKTTMSTLEKLKAKLSLKGSAKAAQNEFAAYRSGFVSLTDSVNKMWASLESDIANRMKNILRMFTVDPLKTGWNEYELKMGSVQTIMASTGESLSTVNRYLDELNRYSDDTIYSFADMTQNIGKFTNAGIKLEDAVLAIKGIANEAALSGANANEASRAMYNFSQALSSGYVKLIDWKSIELANMATVGFKEQLIETAVEMGTLKKASDGMYQTLDGNLMSATKNFNETLQDQWMTSEVLIKTLGKYADETTDIGKKATNAATEVKTFSQLMDTLRESAQSGWARTWEIMFGDFEEGKQLWTMMSKTVGGFIDNMNQARNNLLEGVFSSPWKKFDSLLSKTNVSADKFRDTVKGIAKENGTDIEKLTEKYGSFEAALSAGAISVDVVKAAYEKLIGAEKGAVASTEEAADKLKYFQEVVSKVWYGDYANGEARVKALTAAGYDYASVQALVNKTVDGHKLTLEDLTDAQLKSVGVTDEQVKSIRELEEIAKESGISLNDLMEQMGKPSGRWLLIESLKNACAGLGKVFGAVKEAWLDIFRPDDLATRTKKMYSLLEAIRDFSTKLIPTGETVEKMTRTFRGLFAAIDIVATIVMGPLKIAFKLVTAILSEFGLNIWDVTAYLGDGLVKLRNWIDGTLDFSAAAKRLADPIREGMKAFKEWIASLKESDNIPRDIIKGLVKGFAGGIKTVVELAMDLGKKIIETVKGVLGIHSPSTVFFQIAKNCISGFVNGFKESIPNVWNAVKTGFSKIPEFLGNIDWGTVFAGGLTVGTLFTVKKLIDVVETLAKPLEGVGEMLNGIGDMFQGLGQTFRGLGGLLKAKAWKERGDAILKIAAAIAILAAAVALLTFIEPAKLWNAVGAITALAAVIAGLSFVISKMGGLSFAIKSVSMVGLGLSLIMFSAALLIMIQVIKQLSSLKTEGIWKGIAAIAALSLLFAMLIETAKYSGKNGRKVGSMLLKMSVALLVLVFVIKQIDKLDGEALAKGLFVIGLLGLVFMALIETVKYSGKNASKVGSMLLKMSFALLVMVQVIKQIDKLEAKAIAKGLLVVSALGLLFAAMTTITRKSGKHATKVGSMLFQMSLALLIAVAVIKLVDTLDGKALIKGLAVITGLGAIFAGLVVVAKSSGKNAHKIGFMLLAMSAAMLLLAGVIFILSKIDTAGIIKGAAVIIAIGAMFAGLIAVTKYAKDCKGSLIVMSIAIGLLAAVVIGLSFIDPKKLASATIAIAGVMAAFALLIGVTKFAKNTKQMHTTLMKMLVITTILALLVVGLSLIDTQSAMNATMSLVPLLSAFSWSLFILGKAGKIAKTVSKQIWPMLAVVAGLATILGVLSYFDVTPSIGSAVALGILLTAMTGAIVALSYIGPMASGVKSGIGALALLGLVVGELAIILGLMSHFNVQSSIGAVGSISLLLVVMTGVLAALCIIGPMAAGAMAGIGALALLGLVVGELAIILGLMSHFDVAPSIETAIALSLLLTTMSASLVVLGVVGLLGPAAFIGIGALATLIAGIGGLVVGIGALVDKFPVLETFLDKGIPIIEKIGYAIGSFFGNIIGGFTSGATAGLPEVGTNLAMFITNAMPFITGIKMVDETALTGIKNLTAAVLLLSAADLINGITSFIGGEFSLVELGLELSAFMQAIQPFIAGAAMLNEDMMVGVQSLAKTILILTAADVINGLTSWITGGASLDTFGAQLPGLGTNLAQFARNLGTFGDDQVASVTCAANAIKNMAEAAEAIPNEGGWLAKIVGDNSVSTFGGYLPALGTHMSQFAANLGTFGEDKVNSVTCAANAIKAIAEAAEDIPNEGGWWAKITGDNSIETFGGYLPGLGTNLAGFVANLGEFSDGQVATTKCASQALQSLAEAAEKMPEEGGWWAKLVGDKTTLEEFGTQLPTLAKSLKSFVTELGTFDDNSMSTIKTAIGALNSFADLGAIDLGGLSEDLPTFGEKITSFAGKIKTFCSNMSAVNGDSLNAAIDNINKLIKMFKSFESANADAVKSFADSLTSLGKTGIDNFIAAFTNSADRVKTAGIEMIQKLVSGATEQSKVANENFKTIASNGAEALRDKYQSFYNAGSYLVDGFAAGISENDFKAAAKAKAMAEAAEKAAKEALDINSPSKVFREIGSGVPEGFVQGIDKFGGAVSASTENMADTALDGVKKSIANISKIIGSDLDAQPTIRPVLDLSDVRSGANALSAMFGDGDSIGVLANVGSISAAMNGKGQNGTTDDIISAIKELGSMERNSYNINGITYAEGSDVAEAIKILVRAATVERRT